MKMEKIAGGVMWAIIILTVATFFAIMGMLGVLIGVIMVVVGLCDLFLTNAHYQTYMRDLPAEVMKECGEKLISPFKQRGVIGAITVLAGVFCVALSIMVMG